MNPLRENVRAILHEAPHEPGCYLMMDEEDKVFYVGKAKDLHQRMHQYIHPTGDTRYFVTDLPNLLHHVEFITTGTDKEALILENSLIKKHRPRFNVRIKDDKTYFSLRLDLTAQWPKLEVVRKRVDDGSLYFGPYTSGNSARQVLKLINKHFMLRDCSDSVFRRSRPCVRHEMGRCYGPCSLPVDEETYTREVNRVRLFLEGKKDLLLNELVPQMQEAAKDLDFERAARIRDQIQAIEVTLEKQFMEIPQNVNWDVIGFYREGEFAEAGVVKVRKGRVDAYLPHAMQGYEISNKELLQSFLQQYYQQTEPVISELILPFDLESRDVLEDWLRDRAGHALEVIRPQRGAKRNLLLMAMQNARQSFTRRKEKRKDGLLILERLQRTLHLNRLPQRIECADISTFQGSSSVGSVVCFLGGEPAKGEYRRYKIQQDGKTDDFSMMYEMLSRRFKRGKEEDNLPDLFVVDGGIGQLNVAREVFKELGITQTDLVSLAKSRLKNEVGPGQIAKEEEGKHRTPERVFLPGRKNPVLLKRGTGELFLMERLRDEAHRFAITYHRTVRKRSTLRSGLLDIDGVGPTRMKRLLSHFGSLKRIREATVEEIASLPGIPDTLAERILDHVRQGDDESPSNKNETSSEER